MDVPDVLALNNLKILYQRHASSSRQLLGLRRGRRGVK